MILDTTSKASSTASPFWDIVKKKMMSEKDKLPPSPTTDTKQSTSKIKRPSLLRRFSMPTLREVEPTIAVTTLAIEDPEDTLPELVPMNRLLQERPAPPSRGAIAAAAAALAYAAA